MGSLLLKVWERIVVILMESGNSVWFDIYIFLLGSVFLLLMVLRVLVSFMLKLSDFFFVSVIRCFSIFSVCVSLRLWLNDFFFKFM